MRCQSTPRNLQFEAIAEVILVLIVAITRMPMRWLNVPCKSWLNFQRKSTRLIHCIHLS